MALPQLTSEIYSRPARRRIKLDSNSCNSPSDNIISHRISTKSNFFFSVNDLFIFDVKKNNDFGSSLVLSAFVAVDSDISSTDSFFSATTSSFLSTESGVSIFVSTFYYIIVRIIYYEDS